MAYIGRGTDKISNIEVLDNITFTDSAGPYNITQSSVAFTPISPSALVISIDGIVQSPSSVTVSGSTLTFDSVMASTSTMNFIYQIGVGLITTPGDNTITTAKIVDDAVTYAKMQDIATGNRVLGRATAGEISEVQVSNDMLAGSIANAKLDNSAISINGTSVSLGGSITGIGAQTFPTVTNASPSVIDTSTSTSVTITGTDFNVGVSIEAVNSTTGAILVPATLSRTNDTTLVATFNISVNAAYFIRAENTNGLAGRSSTTKLTVSPGPVWTTSSGSLGSFTGGTTGTLVTVAATGDATLAYTEVTDPVVLTSTAANGANCTLDSSTGVIASTGTGFGLNDGVGKTYSFTLRVTDGEGQVSDRAFTLASVYALSNSGQFN